MKPTTGLWFARQLDDEQFAVVAEISSGIAGIDKQVVLARGDNPADILIMADAKIYRDTLETIERLLSEQEGSNQTIDNVLHRVRSVLGLSTELGTESIPL